MFHNMEWNVRNIAVDFLTDTNGINFDDILELNFDDTLVITFSRVFLTF